MDLSSTFTSLCCKSALSYKQIGKRTFRKIFGKTKRVKNCFGVFCQPFKYLFTLSIVKGIFSGDLKIAKVTPVFKAGDSSDLSNDRPIPVLSCFFKLLER